MAKKRVLGKGIAALIPDMNTATFDDKGSVSQLSIEEIKTNPFQPRKNFSEKEIKELSSSIVEKGILQPLLVTRNDQGYTLIAGERRLRAAYMAGLSMVPVIVKEVDDKEQHEIALIENIQREDLNVIEQAEAFQGLIERFSYTQEEVSKKVGKSRAAITNTLRLLNLSKKIKEDIVQNRITMGHARTYLALGSYSAQEEVHYTVIKKGLSVRQTESFVKKINNKNNQTSNKIENDDTDKAQNEYIINELRKKFSTKINVLRNGEKGKIIIEFYSNEEFNRIYDLLRGYNK